MIYNAYKEKSFPMNRQRRAKMMKRNLFVKLITLFALLAALLLAATRYSTMLPLVIAFELVILFAFGLRFALLYKAFSKGRD